MQVQARTTTALVGGNEAFPNLLLRRLAGGDSYSGHWQRIADVPFLNDDMTVVDPCLTQAQVQPAPANQYGRAVQAATEHSALVVDVSGQRQLQAQLVLLPVEYLQTHLAGQGDVAV
ncbi:hypothetical protein D3C72_1902340 [compost metagenome]